MTFCITTTSHSSSKKKCQVVHWCTAPLPSRVVHFCLLLEKKERTTIGRVILLEQGTFERYKSGTTSSFVNRVSSYGYLDKTKSLEERRLVDRSIFANIHFGSLSLDEDQVIQPTVHETIDSLVQDPKVLIQLRLVYNINHEDGGFPIGMEETVARGSVDSYMQFCHRLMDSKLLVHQFVMFNVRSVYKNRVDFVCETRDTIIEILTSYNIMGTGKWSKGEKDQSNWRLVIASSILVT